MSQSGGGILPLYHSKHSSPRFLLVGRRSRDKYILFIFLFFFSFVCFSWLFIIPDSGNESQRSYTQIYGDFAPHVSNRIDPSIKRHPIPQPPVEHEAVTIPVADIKETLDKEDTNVDPLSPANEGDLCTLNFNHRTAEHFDNQIFKL